MRCPCIRVLVPHIFVALLLWFVAPDNAQAAAQKSLQEALDAPLPMTGSGPKNPLAPQVPDPRPPGLKAAPAAPTRNSTATTPLQAAPAAPADRIAPAGRTEPTLSDMIGQMIMIGMKGFELRNTDPLLASIRAGRAGNILLFERDALGGPKNIESPAQVRLLTARLQKAAPRPLCIAVDQEGGKVQRLRLERGFEGGPAAAVLGAGSPDATRQAARRMGLEMAAVGINMNFAPVADLNINPLNPAIGAMQRSFGANPHLAALHAIAFGAGLVQAGVVPCLKHFPGHGSAREDSHDSLPDITATWQPTELIPFQQAILEGWAGAVMPGHLYHRGLDALRPASLSARVLNGLLRGKMGFAGVIVSDDMQMGAVAKAYSLEDRILLAVEAGVDILVFGNNSRMPDVGADEIHAVLLRLVQQGRISPARIALSFERISRLKQRFAGWKP
ncbi:MAG: glycoside hydrolase family 3 protein [Deltaproteobacteria bacterium]|jgi:beta-N-acetylhexosaminidase|nr:glycoside hydrolase family 3 protein [Deltaproteobacteria bacterium]